MPIKISCACGKRLTADPKLAGKRARCPACKAMLLVPAQEEVADVAVEIVEEEAAPAAATAETEEDAGAYAYKDGEAPADDAAAASRAFAGQAGVIRLREPAACLAYCSDDRWALAGIDNDVQVLDMKNHKRSHKYRKHGEAVTRVCFSPDTRRALSGDESGRLHYWDVNEAATIRRLRGHNCAVTAMAIEASGRYAVTGCQDGRTRLWELDSGDEFELFKSHWDVAIRCVAFSPDSRLIAAGAGRGTVGLWSLESGKLLAWLDGSSGAIESLRFSRDSETLTSCAIDSANGQPRAWRWQIPSGKPLACWESPSKKDCKVLLSALVPGGEYLISMGRAIKQGPNGPVYFATPPCGDAILDLAAAGAHLYAMTQDTSTRDSASQKYRLQIWNVKLGHRVQNFGFDEGKPTQLSVSDSGRRALVPTEDGELHVWGLG